MIRRDSDLGVLDMEIRSELIAAHVAETGISGSSMVVTVFGDAISQHGGWIWLGSLIDALAPFGYSEGLIRTSAFRLVQQDWLKTTRIGRRSHYCFTDSASGHYERAAKRIYAAGHREGDGSWTLVLPLYVPAEVRDSLAKSLGWQGYARLTPGLFAHPAADRDSLKDTISELDLIGKVVVLKAASQELNSLAALKKAARDKWQLDELQDQYNAYLDFYRPLTRDFNPQDYTPQQSFWLRTLMIHDYRRILLRDPEFPQAMLPSGWLGYRAHELVKRVYRGLAARSVAYIRDTLENAEGPLPPPSLQFNRRFGGIR